jgi:hypothetical protein
MPTSPFAFSRLVRRENEDNAANLATPSLLEEKGSAARGEGVRTTRRQGVIAVETRR